MTYAGLVVGLARGALVILRDANVIDTMTHAMADVVGRWSSSRFLGRNGSDGALAASSHLVGFGHGCGDHRPGASSWALLKRWGAGQTAQPAAGGLGIVLAFEPPASVV